MSATLPTEARDLLDAVLAAIDIPCPATVGDGARHQKILAERAMHAAITLRGVLGAGTPSLADLAWQTAYLREQLALHPPTGYRTGPWPGVPVDAGEQPARGGGMT
jgi:hypothetical protein